MGVCFAGCQRKGWKGIHKLVCTPVFPPSTSPSPSPSPPPSPTSAGSTSPVAAAASHVSTPGGLGAFLDDVAASAAAGEPVEPDGAAASALVADPVVQKLVAQHTAVQLVDSKERGRGLVAARDLAPGTLVLSEPPWAAVPQPQYGMQICHHCFGILTQEKGILRRWTFYILTRARRWERRRESTAKISCP